MQTEVELGVLASIARCLDRSRLVDHEARARDDAALVGLDDAAVDASAEAEVIGVDYDIALHFFDCRPRRRSARLSLK
jgi:hypothetical protein